MARDVALISQPEPLSEEAALATLTAPGRTVTGFARQLGLERTRAPPRPQAMGSRRPDHPIDRRRGAIGDPRQHHRADQPPPPLPPARLVEPIDLVALTMSAAARALAHNGPLTRVSPAGIVCLLGTIFK
jgi:hypothetical protein